MNGLDALFEPLPQEKPFETPLAARNAAIAEPAGWSEEQFAEEQLRSLVRQIFFPGWSKSAKQVVFAAVDSLTRIGPTCLQIAAALAAQTSGSICLIRGEGSPDSLTSYGGTAQDPPYVREKWESLRKSSRQVAEKVWAMPLTVFLDGCRGGHSAAWLHGRLEQLRLDFDYTLVAAPPAGSSSDAAVFGNLCDGVILLLEARSTRRLAAQKVKAMLHAANARLLGTILTERTFPIPERIYRNL